MSHTKLNIFNIQLSQRRSLTSLLVVHALRVSQYHSQELDLSSIFHALPVATTMTPSAKLCVHQVKQGVAWTLLAPVTILLIVHSFHRLVFAVLHQHQWTTRCVSGMLLKEWTTLESTFFTLKLDHVPSLVLALHPGCTSTRTKWSYKVIQQHYPCS